MSLFAVIQLGGKQYKVTAGDTLRVEKQNVADGSVFSAPEVLLLQEDKETRIGSPYLEGVNVELKVLGTGKTEKIRVYKMHAKKRYRRTQGHRQAFTEIEVVSIGKGAPKKEPSAKPVPKAKKAPRKSSAAPKKA